MNLWLRLLQIILLNPVFIQLILEGESGWVRVLKHHLLVLFLLRLILSHKKLEELLLGLVLQEFQICLTALPSSHLHLLLLNLLLELILEEELLHVLHVVGAVFVPHSLLK